CCDDRLEKRAKAKGMTAFLARAETWPTANVARGVSNGPPLWTLSIRISPKGLSCSTYLSCFDRDPGRRLIRLLTLSLRGPSALAKYAPVLQKPSPIRGSFQHGHYYRYRYHGH